MDQQETERSRFLNRLLSDQEAGALLAVEDYVRQFDSIAEFVLEEYSVLTGAAQPPSDLDRFEEGLELGRGGMGRVQLARDRILNRQVVLKTLHTGQQTQSSITRLHREAQALGGLDHADVCPILDVVERDGNLTLVLPYLRGETLEVFIKRSAAANPRPPCVLLPGDDDNTPLPRLLSWLARVADAVEVVHGAGFVHRDLKPANLLVREDGTPTVIDFGLALGSANDDQRLTLSGDMVGTPLYMAPEQIEGRDCDARTDVYALGVLLYETLALERPFEGATRQATFHEILTDVPAPLRTKNRYLSRDLEAVCSKAMARDPKRRYVTAGEFADELRRVVRLEPTAARPDSGVRRAIRVVRRRPGRAAALVIGIVGALVATNIYIDRLQAERDASDRFAAQVGIRDRYYLAREASHEQARPLVDELLNAASVEDPFGLYFHIDAAAFLRRQYSEHQRADRVLTGAIERLRTMDWPEADRRRVIRLGIPLADRAKAGTAEDVLGWGLIERAQARTRMGMLEEALQDLSEAQTLLEETENYHRWTNAIHDRAGVLIRSGQLGDEAERLLAKARANYTQTKFEGELNFDGSWQTRKDCPGGVRDVDLLHSHIMRSRRQYSDASRGYLLFLNRWTNRDPRNSKADGDPFAREDISDTSFDFVHAALWYAECLLHAPRQQQELNRCLEWIARKHGDTSNPGVLCHREYVTMLRGWLDDQDARSALLSADFIAKTWSEQPRNSTYYFDIDHFRADVIRTTATDAVILELARDAQNPTILLVTNRNPGKDVSLPGEPLTEGALLEFLASLEAEAHRFLVHQGVLRGPTVLHLQQKGWTIASSLAECVDR